MELKNMATVLTVVLVTAILISGPMVTFIGALQGTPDREEVREINYNEENGAPATFYDSVEGVNVRISLGNISEPRTVPVFMSNKVIIYSNGTGEFVDKEEGPLFGELTGVERIRAINDFVEINTDSYNYTTYGNEWYFVYDQSGTSRIGTNEIYTDNINNVYFAGGNSDYFASAHNNQSEQWSYGEKTVEIDKITGISSSGFVTNTFYCVSSEFAIPGNELLGIPAEFSSNVSEFMTLAGYIGLAWEYVNQPVMITDKAVIYSDGNNFSAFCIIDDEPEEYHTFSRVEFDLDGNIILDEIGGNVIIPGSSWCFVNYGYHEFTNDRIFTTPDFYSNGNLYLSSFNSSNFVTGTPDNCIKYTNIGQSQITVTVSSEPSETVTTEMVSAITGVFSKEVSEVDDFYKISNAKVSTGNEEIILDVYGLTTELIRTETEIIPGTDGKYSVYRAVISIVPIVCLMAIILGLGYMRYIK